MINVWLDNDETAALYRQATDTGTLPDQLAHDLIMAGLMRES